MNIDDAYRLCPFCGVSEELSSGEIYCRRCGAKMIQRCTECNEPIYYPTARFCPSCGQEYRSGFTDGRDVKPI